jgi:hypothetical protein
MQHATLVAEPALVGSAPGAMNVLSTRANNTLPAVLMDPAGFEHAQRVAKMISISPLFPEHLRKPTNDVAISNAILCYNIAARLGEDILTVAQNIYFVAGKPGWSSAFAMHRAYACGALRTPIDFEAEGDGPTLAVTASATLASGVERSVKVSMAMAKAENWTKNPKYQTMPQTMLCYRAASQFVRLYAPHALLGLPPIVDIEDGVTNADTPAPAVRRSGAAEPAAKKAPAAPQEPPAPAASVEDAEVLPPEPEAAPAPQEKPAEAKRAAPARSNDDAPPPIAPKSAAPEGQAAAAAAAAAAAVRAAAGIEKPAPAQEAPAPEDATQVRYKGWAAQIKSELLEVPQGGSANVVALWAAEIEELEAFAPELHADIKELIDEIG